MQFAIGVTVLECSFVKHSHGPLGVKHYTEIQNHSNHAQVAIFSKVSNVALQSLQSSRLYQ
jgi:hypothetical protein